MTIGLGEMIFTVPRDLPSGSCWLELRAVIPPCDGLRCDGGRRVKTGAFYGSADVRTSALEATLTVT